MQRTFIHALIKTPCGRSKYADLASRKGWFALIRLIWFVFFAALQDWALESPDHLDDSKS